MTRAMSRPKRWPWFIAWTVVGAGWMLAVVGAMTIGIFVVPVVGAVTAVVATRRGSELGLAGLLAGASLPLFYIAYLNRDGPGEVCRHFANGGNECLEEMSPLPWLAVGIGLVAVAVWLFVALNRARSHRETCTNPTM